MNIVKIKRRAILGNLSKLNLRFIFREVFCGRSPEARYKVRLAFPFDYDRVMDFMSETYLKSEPSIVNVGQGLAETGSPLLVHSMYASIRAGITFLAEDLDGCIVGAAVNANLRRESIEQSVKIAEACERGPATDIIKFYAYCSKQTDLWSAYGIDNVWECAHLAVHPEHQGRGIAKRLILESWALARDTAYRLFRLDCTNSYTAQIAEGLGWKCVFSIPYRRYFDNGDFIFKCVKEPHTEMKIYVDQLKYYDGYYPPTKRTRR